jgi:hypothetical protein
MGLSAWIGLLAANIIGVIYYVAILPPWQVFYQNIINFADYCALPGVACPAGYTHATLVAMAARLSWIFDWAPLIFIIIALFWAFVSPSQEQGQTWRNY